MLKIMDQHVVFTRNETNVDLLVIFKCKYFDNHLFFQKSTQQTYNLHFEVYVTQRIHL